MFWYSARRARCLLCKRFDINTNCSHLFRHICLSELVLHHLVCFAEVLLTLKFTSFYSKSHIKKTQSGATAAGVSCCKRLVASAHASQRTRGNAHALLSLTFQVTKPVINVIINNQMTLEIINMRISPSYITRKQYFCIVF